MNHEQYMRRALKLAMEAQAEGDVPVGCVIVRNGEIVGEGRNRREERGDATAHAELEAIRDACARTGSWRLHGCTLYVTLEPCPMCAGAIVQARIPRIAVGCMNPKAGCAGSVLDMLHVPGFNHRSEVTEGVLEQECSKLMSDFFQSLRERKK